jgi:hypothetical protein
LLKFQKNGKIDDNIEALEIKQLEFLKRVIDYKKGV